MSDQPVVPDVMLTAMASLPSSTTNRRRLAAALTAARDKYGDDAYLHLGSGRVYAPRDKESSTVRHYLMPIEGDDDE